MLSDIEKQLYRETTINRSLLVHLLSESGLSKEQIGSLVDQSRADADQHVKRSEDESIKEAIAEHPGLETWMRAFGYRTDLIPPSQIPADS